MRPLRPKLLEIYSDWMSPRGWVGQNWGELIHAKYTPHTLSRMLGASSPATRCSAAWALGIVGDIAHLGTLGPLLRDSYKRVRTAANDARRMIQSRTLSPWHRQCAQQIEAMLAADQLSLACDLADDLVEETQCRSDAFMLRAGVRFCNSQLVRAIEDFRSTLAIDPYSYRACIAMGQCYWHLHLDSAARECFLEAARIYPDWTPAYRSLKLLPPSSAVA
jgi:hypothetical protein